MSVNSYDALAKKVLFDLESAIKKDPFINEFYIVPTLESENRNSSPVLKGENTLGLESWIISHIYPYAHHQIMDKNNYKSQNLFKVIPCLTGVALLNPEMGTVWSKRRELIISNKMHADDELRLTRMALSRKPKCNDAFFHRRWIVTEILQKTQDKSSLLMEELRLSEMIANRYHSNYHAWSHRMWCLQHLLPDSLFYNVKKCTPKNSFFDFIQSGTPDLINLSITRFDLFCFNNCKVSRTYFEELENNFKWVSSHVSDHSGLHFRTFLLSEVLTFMKSFFSLQSKNEFCSEYLYAPNAQDTLIPSMFNSGKLNLVEFLNSFDFGHNYKKTVDDYLLNMEVELTLLDIAIFLIITELKLNCSLCLMFSNHEALWCYRRFLIYSYKRVIYAIDSCKNNLGQQKIPVHQDRNGVPCRKDFKYDHMQGSDSNLKHSNLFIALYTRILSNEEKLISKINLSDEYVRNIVQKYGQWLRYCFGDKVF